MDKPKQYNIIQPGKAKELFDPKSEFMKELEIQRIKCDIKPRKVDIMKSQDEFAIGCMLEETKSFIVNKWDGKK